MFAFDKNGVEKRGELRIPADEPVVITVLSPAYDAPFGGVLKDVSGTGMLLGVPRCVEPGTPVKIETRDMLMLGEVVRLEREGEDYLIALRLRHSLRDLRGLQRLNRALLRAEEAGQEALLQARS